MSPNERENLDATLTHIRRVQELLNDVVERLLRRAVEHDVSKLEEPEFSRFAATLPRLAETTYGSDEYQDLLDELKPALDHHYAHNAHHPEHHDEGVNDMTLLDLVEMLVDWKGASERHDDGDIIQSIVTNQERFDLSNQLARVLLNTAVELGWITESDIEAAYEEQER